MAKTADADPTVRDRCQRPKPTYNQNYNPHKPPPEDLPLTYSPYAFGEPLFDDRPIIITNLAAGLIVAPPGKRPRTAWVWKLGYAVVNTRIKAKPVYWTCKHCKLLLLAN
jgi:hypothetical protein